jgi:PadR family transcriptional regulator, regulatory protein AphA
MTTLPTTAFAVLGLLSLRDMSGYELAAFADQSLAYFWPMHRSLVYRELRRLEEGGYVAGTQVVQDRVPDKRVYRLTELGRAALDGWLATPGFQPPRLRSEFLVKFFFARRLGHEQRWALLREYRAAVELDLADLQATADRLNEFPEGAFWQLAALHGVRTRQALLQWIADVEQALAAMPGTAEATEEADR